MRRLLMGVLALAFAVPALRGLDPPPDKPKPDKPPTVREQIRAVQKEMQSARQKDVQAYFKAKSEDEKEKALKRYEERPKEFTGRLLKLATEEPKDPAAFDALVLVVAEGTEAEADEAADLLLANQAGRLTSAAGMLSRAESPAAAKVLKGALEKATTPKAKTQAAVALGEYYKSRAQKAHEDGHPDAESLTKSARELFEQVAKDKEAGATATQAKGALFELTHLWYGQKAPEIEGEDVGGKKFKLSDYRGKVVLLDFWGNW